jgi:hypothetical protein
LDEGTKKVSTCFFGTFTVGYFVRSVISEEDMVGVIGVVTNGVVVTERYTARKGDSS